ncbi:MAG: hypothetical protein LUD02_14825 [Tannerellaceae bacterium]|nr:hypothetical protein [Tannerellaceae bacterium]
MLLGVNIHFTNAQLPVDSMLASLDMELDNRNFHYQKKEDQLNTLKIQLKQIDNLHQQFDLYNQLYNEYIYYQYDSAYSYAKKGLEIAHKLQDERLIAISQLNFMSCYTSSGFYTEAYKLSLSIPVEKLPEADKVKYYSQCHGLYENLYHYTRGTDFENIYKQKACNYADSCLIYLKSGTFEYEFNAAFIFATVTEDKRKCLNGLKPYYIPFPCLNIITPLFVAY